MQRTITSKKQQEGKKVYGYICMPMEEEGRNEHLFALKNFPVRSRNIFDDRFEGAPKGRPQYLRLTKCLKPGDIVVLQSLECLGTGYEEILKQWNFLTKEKRAEIVVLDIPALDTRHVVGKMGSVPMEELVKQLLLYVVQREKKHSKEEVALGREREEGPKTYGYIRVSARDQCEDRQLLAMREFSVREEDIFIDKMSGKDFEREQYKRLLMHLRPGDTLVIKEIDRLGRNYEEILEQWRIITKERKVNIVVLDMPLLNTGKTANGLTGTFVEDLVLQILSYVAQIERENIRKRQKEGIEAAKKRGERFGRPKKQMPPSFARVRREWLEHSISSREAARQLGVSQNTFLRWIRAEMG